MRKISVFVLFVALITCVAGYAYGKTVVKDNVAEGKSDYYARGVPAVTPDGMVSQESKSKEDVNLRNYVEDISLRQPTNRPGAAAVQNAQVLVVGDGPAPDLSSYFTIKEDGGVLFSGDLVLDQGQTLVIRSGSSITFTGTVSGGVDISTTGPDVLSGITYYGSYINIHNPYISSNFTVTQGSILPLSTQNVGVVGSMAGAVLIPGYVGSTISVSATEETVNGEVRKNDDAKALGIKNRQNKQGAAMKKIIAGKSVIDEE